MFDVPAVNVKLVIVPNWITLPVPVSVQLPLPRVNVLVFAFDEDKEEQVTLYPLALNVPEVSVKTVAAEFVISKVPFSRTMFDVPATVTWPSRLTPSVVSI